MTSYKMTDVTPRVREGLKKISRKRSILLQITDSGTDNFGTWWDGGSRRKLSYLNITTGSVIPLPAINPPEYGGNVTDIPHKEGYLIVDCGTFCGKPSYPKLYVHPDDVGNVIGQELVGKV
jgi:hypothetical protein